MNIAIAPEVLSQVKVGDITRFAPSPSGYLHLGHCYSAMFTHHIAAASGNKMLLRIDDIDSTRCKPHFIDAIFSDLDFLDIPYAQPVRNQSQHLDSSRDALRYLQEQDLIYPCYLSRREINDLLSAPHEATNTDQLINPQQREDRENSAMEPAWRLRMDHIRRHLPSLAAYDLIHGQIDIDLNAIADEVIARRDIGSSYLLSTVLDDHDTGITLITRGDDLLHVVPVQRILQELLGFNAPRYAHHKLIMDNDGDRFAKRNNALGIHHLRQKGMTRDEIIHAMTKCRDNL
ncbi:MAG: tRNA glutamyl-Q(34) synthetase GluQRS [Candidatus Puniceispirillales bacterium]